jgi:Tfp pilus assembly protein PilX
MRHLSRQPRGLALLIVITVIAIASLLGIAMLSAATLQAQVAHSSQDAATADYLAESAVQTAAYYLQHDLANCPSSWTSTAGHKIKASGVTISGVDGSFDIDATATSITDRYLVNVVGRSSGSTPVTRTASAKVTVLRTTPSYASGFGGNSITIGSKNIFNGAPVAYNASLSNNGTLNGGSRVFTASDFSVPTSASGQVNYYGGNIAGGTYTMPNGNIGTPQILSTATITSTASLTALATNPGKVFYSAGSIVITGAGTYNATLVARGAIDFRPAMGSVVTINRVAGFPALVTDGTLAINFKSGTLTINGVTFLGGGTSWGALTNTAVKINGALLTPSPTLSAAAGSLTVNYIANNVDVLNLTPNLVQPVVGLKLADWSQ